MELFSRFPTIGPRTAARFVFYLLKAPQLQIDELINATLELRKEIKFCTFCLNPFDQAQDLEHTQVCSICRNPSRDRALLCVVEKESDLEAFEKTASYQGLYFILGGTVGTLQKEDLKSLHINELKIRLKDQQIKEIILALNPTTEGEATSLYLERILKPSGKKITRLCRGLPIGGELEYADEQTLKHALEGRK